MAYVSDDRDVRQLKTLKRIHSTLRVTLNLNIYTFLNLNDMSRFCPMTNATSLYTMLMLLFMFLTP